MRLSAGTLSGAAYAQSLSYDALGRLASVSTAGSYGYGDAAHLHAATAITGGGGASAYSAAYDAAGNMLCRAPSGTPPARGVRRAGRGRSWPMTTRGR